MIDDDEDDQEFFVTAVNQISVELNCTTLSNAQEAFQKLNEKTLTPDIIFLDLNMPVMNGQQFLVEIKKHPTLTSIPVIIFSTSSHTGTIQLMKELGAKDFMTKPDKYDKLVVLLTQILNRSEIAAK